MKTIYESRKRVTRELEGSTHTLPILFEYAWSMLRVCLQYAYSMPRVCLAYAYTHLIWEISVRARRTASPLPTDQESAPYGLFLTLLLLFSGVVGSWGQDYSGTYYIASGGLGQKNNTGTDDNTKYTYDPSDPSNNFYLCPTEGWCYYQATNDFWPSNTDEANKTMPFLTTYKCRDGVYDASKAVWIIKKVKKVDNKEYYYIKQKNTERYLVSNGQIRTTGSKGQDRIRVHLENLGTVAESDLDDKALFSIDYDNVCWRISPKDLTNGDYYTAHNDHAKHTYLVVNFGNYNYLVGRSDKDGGPTGYTNTAGTIGIYTQTDVNTPFYLEDYIKRPNIAYNSSNLIEITAAQTGEGITIKYTTDGKTPTSEYGETYSGPFDPPANTTTIKAIAIVNGEESNVATFTPPVFLGYTHKYLIQSQGNGWTTGTFQGNHYYMIPGDKVGEEPNKITKVNTTSMLRPSMQWYFLNAGDNYYYIVNNVNMTRMRYNTTSGIHMDTWDDNNANEFKFQIVESATAGTYNIIPYGVTVDYKYLNKASGNAGDGALGLHNSATDANSRWKFVPQDTPLADTPPFTPSGAGTSVYYKIQNGNGTTYHLTPPASADGNATASNASDDATVKSMSWYFTQVEASTTTDWLSYYKIINAVTGKALYYNYVNNTSNCLKVGDYDGSNDNYKFAFVKSPTADYYYIVPKSHKDDQLNNISTFSRSNSSIIPATTRAASGNVWTFTPADLFCNTPEFIEEDGKIRIKCNTNAANIYINTESDADPTSGSTLYDPTDPNNATTQNWAITDKVRIKAIAIVSDGTTPASSSVISLLNNPDITLSQYTYTYDGTAKQPAVNEVSIGEAPNKTTATAGTDYEAVIATDYSNNINAGTAKVTLRDKASNVYVWHAEKEFTINKKDLTATADDITVSYGDDVPTYTISYTGFENSEDASAVTTPPTITCAYTSTSDVNTYPISVNTDGVATNYNIIPGTPRTLTVNQREVVLSWETTPIIYNGTAQAPTATATNLKNEDVIGVTVDGAQTNAGDYTATASALTGDKKDNYKLPTANKQDFTIGKRPVTVSGITASDKEYDGTTAATLVLTGATFADGDIIGTDNVTIESATGAFADANAGTGKTITISAITLGGTSVANYEFAGSSQQTEITANITKAPLTATADNQNVTYGDAAPTYTITYAGWKNGESATALTTEPTASCEYTQGSDAGSYPITVTGGVATNYAITNQNGTLTVGPKTLTQDNISFGEGGIVVVKDGETTLTEGTDYTIGEEQHSGINNKYTVTPVIGKNDGTSSGTGNYTGTVSIRHANVHLTTGANQANYSATFVAESAGATDIGHVLPEGFTAYIISGIEGSWAIPEPMEYIPAGVPVLLVANEEKNGFLVRDAKSADVSDISAQKSYNKLKEVTAESAHFNTRQIYVLYKNEFVLNKEGDLAKGKVYMENPKYVAPSSPAPASLSIAWGNVTGIEDGRWKMEDGRSDRWYTLDGRCLIGKPTAKGLYIVNGKKRVVK